MVSAIENEFCSYVSIYTEYLNVQREEYRISHMLKHLGLFVNSIDIVLLPCHIKNHTKQ